MVLTLKTTSSDEWLRKVLEHFDQFLLDHAANEKKAAGVAMNLAAHYPDRPSLVAAMIEIAIEELSHYRDVFKLVRARNLILPPDQKDRYVNQLRSFIRRGRDEYFLDRLLVAAVIEARGLERFQRVAEGLEEQPIKLFYQAIARSEARHSDAFLKLAYEFHPSNQVEDRLETLVKKEAEILSQLPTRAALH